MKLVIPALAALMLAAPALAQDAPPAAKPDRAARFAEHHAQMCENLYAHAVGKYAELEVKLNLTPTQKPLFERWKNIRLAAAKDHSVQCADMKPMDRQASIVDHQKRQIAMLETRLADLKAQTPALEALSASLDKSQAETLARAGREGAMMRARFAERFFEHRGPHMPGKGPRSAMMDGPMGGPMDRPDGAPGMGADD